MLKKIMLTGAILIAGTGVAAAGPVPYIGAGIGISSNTSTDSTGGNAAAARVVPIKLFAGYGGLVTQSFYVGGELEGTLASAEISDKNNAKTTYGFGLSLIPGLMLNQHTMAYVRVGYVRSRFSDVNLLSSGGVFGLGLETTLTQHVDVRGEYDFTAYRSVGSVGAPRSDAFNLGLVYNF